MKKANILFIIMDDQRFDTISLLGNTNVHTPSLDRLAKDGFVFHKTYVTTPICTPGRAEVLTGCNSFHNGVRWFRQAINSDLTLLPQAFAEAGYHCIHVGKWHNDGHPRDGKGFHVARRELYQDNMNNYAECGHWLRYKEGEREVSGHSTELFTDAALEELDAAPQDRPWFLHLAYHSPHDPFESPEPFHSMYDRPDFPLPDNFMPEPLFDTGDNLVRDEQVIPAPRTPEQCRRMKARYYGMISHHDYHIGRILQRLKSTGELENTLIVFTSDHGLSVGSHGFIGKANMYEHSCRIPLIMAGPGVPAGSSQAITHAVDIYPTLFALAAIQLPGSVRDGKTMEPLFSDANQTFRESSFSAFCGPAPDSPACVGEGTVLRETQRMVCTDNWKLVYYAQSHRFQLFNLQNDPSEMNDLMCGWRREENRPWNYRPEMDIEEIKRITGELMALMLQHMLQNDDPLIGQLKAEQIRQKGY